MTNPQELEPLDRIELDGRAPGGPCGRVLPSPHVQLTAHGHHHAQVTAVLPAQRVQVTA